MPYCNEKVGKYHKNHTNFFKEAAIMTKTEQFTDIGGLFAKSREMVEMCRGTVYGYLRVSTQAQSHERQVEAMRELGVLNENMFFDKQSGKDFDRPGYNSMLELLKTGDLLVIKSLDRLGRNTAEAKEQWRILTKEKHVSIVVIDTPVLNAGKELGPLGEAVSDIILTIFSLIADFDRFSIIQRTQEGILNSVKRGTKLGRKPLPVPDEFYIYREKYIKKEISQRLAAKELGIARGTFAKWLRELDEEENLAVKNS